MSIQTRINYDLLLQWNNKEQFKKQTIATCNINESQTHYPELKRLNKQNHTVWATLYKINS